MEATTAGAAGHAPDRPRLRGRIHRVAFWTFPVVGALVVADAPDWSHRWPAFVFVAGMTGVFAVSSTFHLGQWSGVSYLRMRRLDHSMNAVAIAAGYTPFLAYLFAGSARTALLVGYWALALAVVGSRVLWINAPPKAAAASFLTLGWLGVLLLPAVARRIDPADLVLAFVAAGLFSVGAAIYAVERPDPWPRTFGYHEIFHLLALGGQVLLLFVVWRQFP